MRVLVIEDDRRLAALLNQGLREEGYQVTVSHNGTEGLTIAETAEFDVIVLDIMLPGIDGLEITRRLRRGGRQTPVLMLTARNSHPDIIKGLDVGADDYLAKPFAFDVFIARVRAAGRRGPAPQSVVLTAGALSLDTASREVSLAGELVSVTRTEYLILELLMRRRGRVVTREAIIEEVWGYDRDVESNTLDAFMKLLRSKVDREREMIQTVRGVGYMLRAAEE